MIILVDGKIVSGCDQRVTHLCEHFILYQRFEVHSRSLSGLKRTSYFGIKINVNLVQDIK